VVSPVGGDLRKLNTGAQLHTLPSNAFMAKSGAQILTFKSVTDKQAYRQTDKNQPVECLYTRCSRLSNRLFNRFDNRLYRVNGV